MRVAITQADSAFSFAVPLDRGCCLEAIEVALVTENAGVPTLFSQPVPLIVQVDEYSMVISLAAAQPITPGFYVLGFTASGCGEVVNFTVEVQVSA